MHISPLLYLLCKPKRMKVFILFDFILIFFLQNTVRKTFKKCVCFTHAKDFKYVF